MKLGKKKMDQVSDKIGDVRLASSGATEQEGTSERHKLERGPIVD